MAYDKILEERVNRLIAKRRNLVSKKMFGGIAYMLQGNMCLALWEKFLVARIGPENYEESLELEGVVEFAPSGKPMRGWVMIAPEVIDEDEELEAWVRLAMRFVKTLPAK